MIESQLYHELKILTDPPARAGHNYTNIMTSDPKQNLINNIILLERAGNKLVTELYGISGLSAGCADYAKEKRSSKQEAKDFKKIESRIDKAIKIHEQATRNLWKNML